jgi:hypothetical protein
LKLDEFDVKEYEHYEKVENGDWNVRLLSLLLMSWTETMAQFITPHFLAFASPTESHYSSSSHEENERIPDLDSSKLSKPFKNVLEQFAKNNVQMVIRCVSLPALLSSKFRGIIVQTQQEAIQQTALYRSRDTTCREFVSIRSTC